MESTARPKNSKFPDDDARAARPDELKSDIDGYYNQLMAVRAERAARQGGVLSALRDWARGASSQPNPELRGMTVDKLDQKECELAKNLCNCQLMAMDEGPYLGLLRDAPVAAQIPQLNLEIWHDNLIYQAERVEGCANLEFLIQDSETELRRREQNKRTQNDQPARAHLTSLFACLALMLATTVVIVGLTQLQQRPSIRLFGRS
jgi:ribosomal protein L29